MWKLSSYVPLSNTELEDVENKLTSWQPLVVGAEKVPLATRSWI
jgi:hypothetical protein